LKRSFEIGDREYVDPNIGVIFVGPWLNDMVVVTLSGTTIVGDALAYKTLPMFTG
jgi:hypothetical protein